ncbi:MAG TPA: AI-2E family transporter [Microvirga sp.]|jgi:predicted PurR-regulated permease PerM|nr:AI-2E family transporter [Microvirga sp.]
MDDGTHRWRWQTSPDADFVRRVLIVLGLLALGWVFWRLIDVLLLVFGAVLVAVILHAFAEVLERYVRVPSRWSLAVATLVVIVMLGGILVLFGAQMRGQLSNVAERLPLALDSFSRDLGIGPVSDQLPQIFGMDSGGSMASRVAGIGGRILNGLADAILVVIAGIYIAASPALYRRGLVKLFPKGQHERVEESLDSAGQALKLWLTAQLISMTGVGILTTAAAWLIGLPSPLGLGFIAALCDFVPFVGPIIGALPAVLLSFTLEGNAVIWTILAFVVIQQIEGNIIMPIAEKHMVAIPPALALFAILAGGVLFGTLGLIFGFPLAVVVYVLVKKLYVRETLGQPTPVPGEKEAQAAKAAEAAEPGS